MLRFVVWIGVAVVATGCGGKVFVDGGGGAASTSTSTSVAASTTTAARASSAEASSSHATSTATGTAIPGDCSSLGLVDVGTPCSEQGVQCQMDVCCTGLVICSGGVWTAMGPKCDNGCTACGAGLDCGPGAVCVTDEMSPEVGYRCVPDPCAGDEQCACGGSACTSFGLTCVDASPKGLTCTNGNF